MLVPTMVYERDRAKDSVETLNAAKRTTTNDRYVISPVFLPKVPKICWLIGALLVIRTINNCKTNKASKIPNSLGNLIGNRGLLETNNAPKIEAPATNKENFGTFKGS